MSEEPNDALDSAIRFFEAHISGGPFTAEERANFEQLYKESAPYRESFRLAHDTMARAEAMLNHMRKLKARQGSIVPDFDALYRRKKELDGESP